MWAYTPKGQGVTITRQQLKEIKKAMIDRDLCLKDLRAHSGLSITVICRAINGGITASLRLRRTLKSLLDIDVSAFS